MLLKRQLLLRQRQTKCQEESRLQKSRERLTEKTEMAAIATMKKIEGRIFIILILPQEITMQDAKWKNISERQKRTDTTTIVMLRLIRMTSIMVQASMNQSSGLKMQCVKKPAERWTDASRKLTDTVILRQAEVRLMQSVAKTEPETELITAITQTVTDRLTAAQGQVQYMMPVMPEHETACSLNRLEICIMEVQMPVMLQM